MEMGEGIFHMVNIIDQSETLLLVTELSLL